MPTHPQFRAFISYSHEDSEVFEAVRSVLQEANLTPQSDQDLVAGPGFPEQIQNRIAHAHLFVPIITPQSHKRGWVHQEIGYAVALKVPCIPVCLGEVPDGMISLSQAVAGKDIATVVANLKRENLLHRIENAAKGWAPPITCAREPEERAEIIEKQCTDAVEVSGASCVRIHGGLTSFSIPKETTDHPIWAARYGLKPRSVFSYRKYREERLALERHAAIGGVKLIVNLGFDTDVHYGPGTRRTRLSILLRFLESLDLPDEKVMVALMPEMPPEMMLAVGDWFVAETSAARPVRGIVQTVFTAHAPTVSNRVNEFDLKIQSTLADQGIPLLESRSRAMTTLKEFIPILAKSPLLPDEAQ